MIFSSSFLLQDYQNTHTKLKKALNGIRFALRGKSGLKAGEGMSLGEIIMYIKGQNPKN